MDKLKHGEFLTVEEVRNKDIPYPPSHITESNIQVMWERNITGEGITVAVIDSGCDLNQPLLSGKIKDYYNFTLDGDGNDITDYKGHGTHVAGIIAAESFNHKVMGIAPDVSLLIYKVIDKEGIANYDNVAQAIYAAAQGGADIINLSLCGRKEAPQIHEAIKFAYNMGVLVVCASGNIGDGDSDTQEILYPAYYPEVIQVGSIGEGLEVSNFSNSNDRLDCLAPGETIISTGVEGGFYVLSGTSQSAPVISSCLALIKQWAKKEKNIQLKGLELKKELEKHLIKLSDVSSTAQGKGYIYINKDVLEGEMDA